ncbi:MAG: SDR family oxidoreductase [Planctomycetota bacterium]|nr:SDR family oxidoreductase [Planctomycetota bacterium]
MDLHLKGKVALVTGGSRGLGRAVCLALAAEGAKVAVNYRESAGKAQAVADEIVRAGGAAVAVRADVASEPDVMAMYDLVEKALGPVEILINNAAYCPVVATTEITVEEWSRAFQVNVTGTFLCSREMIRRLLAAGRKGRIVNISSQAAFRGSESGKTAYDASKGAIVSFTVSLAREMAAKGIAVNAVAPGLMYTEMLAPYVDANPEKFNARLPIGRLGLPEEVADVVALLASDRAAFMTGATVDVSGGMLMR